MRSTMCVFALLSGADEPRHGPPLHGAATLEHAVAFCGLHLHRRPPCPRRLYPPYLFCAPPDRYLPLSPQVRALPIRKDDEVKIMRGPDSRKNETGKVVAVYRKKFAIHVERITKDKAGGACLPCPCFHPRCSPGASPRWCAPHPLTPRPPPRYHTTHNSRSLCVCAHPPQQR